jgi:hypothetical protein
VGHCSDRGGGGHLKVRGRVGHYRDRGGSEGREEEGGGEGRDGRRGEGYVGGGGGLYSALQVGWLESWSCRM